MNSMVKRSTDSNLSFSRSSQIKIPQERYLTKEEVLVKCKTITLNQSSITNNSQLEPFISSHNTSQNNGISFNITQGVNSTINSHQTSVDPRSKSSEFSMRKVLTKMKKYQDSWKRQTDKRGS